MAFKIDGFVALTGGGTGALDKISVADKVTNDAALGVVSSVFYVYRYNSASSAAEDSPNVIAPDSGSGRWELVSMVDVDASLTANADNRTASQKAIKAYINGLISDTAYAASWDGVTDVAPSKNAVYDEMELRAPKANPIFSGLITSAGQIKFPATQNACSDVNTLDDYEEGTWTPDFAVTSYAWSSAPSNVAACYTKIGRLVIFFIVGNGGVCEAYDRIGGLPFVCGAAGTIILVSIAVQNVVSPGLMEPGLTEIKNLAAFSPAGWWHTIGVYLT